MIEDYDAGTKRAVLRLYRSVFRHGMGSGLARELSAFRGPVLVLWGRHDPYIPASYAVRQREVWPHARVHVLEESGHWPMLDDVEGTARLLLGFLRESIDRKEMPSGR
jgi:pimeloyl-ACP methyl ester carboxylesterase